MKIKNLLLAALAIAAFAVTAAPDPVKVSDRTGAAGTVYRSS